MGKYINIDKLKEDQKIRALFKIFKKYIPISRPVKLIVRKLAFDDGMCGWAGDGRKGFIISVSKELCYNCKVDTIVHEYAHAITMAGGDYDSREDHDGKWGEAYDKVYRCFLTNRPEYGKKPRLIEKL